MPTAGVRVDWLTMTGPEELRWSVVSYLVEFFGEEPQAGGQLQFYRSSFRWGSGAVVAFDQRGGSTCMVQLGGDALGPLTPERQRSLVRGLWDLGLRATRVDIAVDVVSEDGEPVGLIDDVESGCRRGELCGARRWSAVAEYGRGGKLVGRGVYIGKRGKEGSGRCVCVYDKGLETGERPAGLHERWEARYYDGCALVVAGIMCDLDDSEWESRLYGLAFSAVEFREALAGVRRSRRPVCGWWRRWVAGAATVIVRALRRRPSLERTAEWLRRAVLPSLLSMARGSGETVGDVLRRLGAGARGLRRPSTVVRQYVEWVEELRLSGVA